MEDLKERVMREKEKEIREVKLKNYEEVKKLK
jgi:hypothetical protein